MKFVNEAMAGPRCGPDDPVRSVRGGQGLRRLELEQAAVASGHKVFLPHGAIVGIDGLVDAGPTLTSVTHLHGRPIRPSPG